MSAFPASSSDERRGGLDRREETGQRLFTVGWIAQFERRSGGGRRQDDWRISSPPEPQTGNLTELDPIRVHARDGRWLVNYGSYVQGYYDTRAEAIEVAKAAALIECRELMIVPEA